MKIALTFDIERDLPNFLNTYFSLETGLLKILDILDNFNIKGTFFCTGNVAENRPATIRQIERKRHEIACHGLGHERLNKLEFDTCKDMIYKNKKLLEEICKNTEIFGFRAPYLQPPRFLFEILSKLGFRYDSSIKSPKRLPVFQTDDNIIQEFHPSKYSIYLRLPYPFIKRKLIKSQILILYFHPHEAINMRNLISKKTSKTKTLTNLIFRPDRWLNTGAPFLKSLQKFIKESLDRQAEFITLKQLLA